MNQSRPARSWRSDPGEIPRLPAVTGLERVGPEWAWEGSTGRGVKVGVIDSGIENSHPAIDGRVQGYVRFPEGAGDTPEPDYTPHGDDFGHGTACAGIIRRYAPDCELYSIKVLGAALAGRANTFIAGLRWAIEQEMDVVNLSLGTTRQEYFGIFHELVDAAYFKDVMLVTAANNMPTVSFPSLFAAVTSVASHEGSGEYEFYYNPEPPVEFWAPGINVSVAWLGGQQLTVTGNSFSAPHITGLVAKILGKHPALKPFEVKTVLRATARNVGGVPRRRSRRAGASKAGIGPR
jgi:subtilisin family serine protease